MEAIGWDLRNGPRPVLIMCKGGPRDGWVFNRLAMANEPPVIFPDGASRARYLTTGTADEEGREIYQFEYIFGDER